MLLYERSHLNPWDGQILLFYQEITFEDCHVINFS